jgi:hypothetical protein
VAGAVQRLPLAHLGIYVDGLKQPETSKANATLVSCPNGSCDKSWGVCSSGALSKASDAG